MSHLTGSLEEQSATLQEREQQEQDERIRLDAEYQEQAMERQEDMAVQFLFHDKRGMCDYCHTPIPDPAGATRLDVDGKDWLLHKEEWLTASLSRVKRQLAGRTAR